jgi:hypothetical protein
MNKSTGHVHDMEKVFDWDDQQIYKWLICGSKKSVPLFALSLIAITLIVPASAYLLMLPLMIFLSFVLAIPVSLFGGVSERSLEVIKLWTGIGVMIILIVITLYFLWLAWKGSGRKELKAQSHLHELLTTSIGVVAFVMSNLIGAGFRGHVESFGQWLLFFIDNFFHSVLFLDIPEIFDFRLSDIEPHTWYARFATVLLRFFISAGLIDSFWVFYQRTFYKENFYGTVKDCLWKCQSLLDRSSLQLKREGKVEPFAQSEGFVNVVDFVEALDQRDYEASKPDKK